MAINLEIEDGVPYWYLSNDIWTVPDSDPNSSIGIPIADMPTFVWARVHNKGTTPVFNATVRYYWANPSTVITPSTAYLIGTSYVSLQPGESKEVLCITPWIPEIVNNGHECLVVETFSPADPLSYGPNDPFNPPNDRHVAQKNLDIIKMKSSKIIVKPFTAKNHKKFRAEKIQIIARQIPIKEIIKSIKSIGLSKIFDREIEIKEFGLQPFQCGDQVTNVGKPELSLQLEPGKSIQLALAMKIPEKIQENVSAFFIVEQKINKKTIGGVATLLISDSREYDDQTKQEEKY